MERYRKYTRASLLLAGVLALVFFSVPGPARAGGAGSYQQINLVSDLPNTAQFQDPNLVNPWGLSHSPTSPWWISDNGMGVSTLYRGNGQAVPLVVTIPPPMGGTPPATPTGNVFNSVNGTNPGAFVVGENGKSGPSLFIFATEDGTISGWNRTVDLTNAILAVDRSTVGAGAVYKGLAFSATEDGVFLYATNFRFGTVEMFDANFNLVRSFTDDALAKDCPFVGQCYAPFGIQNIQNKLYVTFALQDPNKHDDEKGPGRGFVDVFNVQGHLLRRFASQGTLTSPWGLAFAPRDFGPFSNDVLVGNFGDGRINAFDPHTGAFLGQLSDQHGSPITIDGLWGLAFGNGAAAGAQNELFFTAGINDEADGLFGKIEP
jgi:uncharacterized protein (TIGR03118 family)